MSKWYERAGTAAKDFASDIPVLGGLFGENSYDKAGNLLMEGADRGRTALTEGRDTSAGYMQPYYKTGMDAYQQQAKGVMGGLYDQPDFQSGDISSFAGQRVSGAPQSQQLNQLSYEDFQKSPAYQVQMEQGQEAIDRMAAAGRIPGGYSGTAATEQLMQHGQNLAAGEYARQDQLQRDIQQANMGNLQQDWQNQINAGNINYQRGMGENQLMQGRNVQDYQMGRQGLMDQYGMMQDQAAPGMQAAGALSNIYGGYGRDIAGLETDLASARAGITAQEGQENKELMGALFEQGKSLLSAGGA
jgi:hypothetical protein